jgi:DNA modification methylase
MAGAGLSVTYKDPKSLTPRPTNPRTHSKRQIQQIADSIKAFGFVNPVLVDQVDGIIAGHGRVLAAMQLGMSDVPTVRVDHLSPAQVRAYVIADNKLAENAGWDRQLLAIELKELSVNLDFEITNLGFETAELDLLIGELDGSLPDSSDIVPEIDRTTPTISKAGDLWKIGNHFLLCGDSTCVSSYEILLQGAKAEAVFTDPPYNVAIEGNVSGLGKVTHKDFAMASGEMSKSEFTGFLRKVFGQLVAFTVDGSLHYICMDWRHTGEMSEAGAAYTELKNLCVWVKTNAGMGAFYRSQHELIYVFKNGSAGHVNNVELGRFGRNRTNVWTYPGVTGFGKERDQALAMHPTVKPVALVADAIMDCTHRNGIVLDAFCGSGTTLVAAEKTGRRGYGIELDRHYCDTILQRMKDLYGINAVKQNSISSSG